MAKLLLGKEVTDALNANLQVRTATLREKGVVASKCNGVGGGRHGAAVHLHCVADGLKCVKRYADGKNKTQCGQRKSHAQSFGSLLQSLDKKSEILESGKHAKTLCTEEAEATSRCQGPCAGR